MAAVNMDAIQFYNPAFTTPSISAKGTTTIQKQSQFIGIRHHKGMSRILKPYSQSQSFYKDIAGKQDGHASHDPATTDEDEFLPVDEVIRRALSKELSTKQLTNSACTA
jgi:hypothetical protein